MRFSEKEKIRIPEKYKKYISRFFKYYSEDAESGEELDIYKLMLILDTTQYTIAKACIIYLEDRGVLEKKEKNKWQIVKENK